METQNIPTSLVVLYFVLVSVIFVIGMLLQIKIIKTAMQEKPVTWQTQIFHSIVMIIHFSLVALLDVLEYMIPNYNGAAWICTVIRTIRKFGAVTISANSLFISLQKYIVIVNRINDNSERHKIEIVSLVLYVTLLILFTVSASIRDLSSIDTYFRQKAALLWGFIMGQMRFQISCQVINHLNPKVSANLAEPRDTTMKITLFIIRLNSIALPKWV